MMLRTSPSSGRSTRTRWILVSLLALLVSVAAFAQQGAESPDALVAALQKVGANKDVKGLVHLVAPSQLTMLAFQTDMAADMMVAMSEDQSKKQFEKDVAKLRKKYGVSLEKADKQPPLEVDPNTPQEVIDAHVAERAHLIYDGVDVAGYAGDLMTLLMATPEMTGKAVFPDGKPGKIQVDGDNGTVKIGETEYKLVRETGRWYISAPGS